jgi:hypothetical protein
MIYTDGELLNALRAFDDEHGRPRRRLSITSVGGTRRSWRRVSTPGTVAAPMRSCWPTYESSPSNTASFRPLRRSANTRTWQRRRPTVTASGRGTPRSTPQACRRSHPPRSDGRRNTHRAGRRLGVSRQEDRQGSEATVVLPRPLSRCDRTTDLYDETAESFGVALRAPALTPPASSPLRCFVILNAPLSMRT